MGRKAALTIGIFLSAVALTLIVLISTASPFAIPTVSRRNIPPVITAVLQHSNAAVQIFSSGWGMFFILPDGSLWRWGKMGGNMFSRTAVPEPVETNHVWLQASAADNTCVAICSDGTYWTWGQDFAVAPLSALPRRAMIASPEQVGSDHDWIKVAAGDSHSVVLKKDGTIWAWGDNSRGQIGNALGPFETNTVRFSGHYLHLTTQTNLVQVGANNDWIDISSSHNDGWYTLGIRADGSLWVWGQILQYGNRQPGEVFSVPTRVCKETNWVRLDGRNAFTRNGEMWRTLYAAPDASLPASSNCDYLITNCLPEKFAFAGSGLYQLHSDGTLWRTQLDYNQDHTVSPRHQGTRVGNRADWLKLWGSRGTAIGLTRDGTLWIWGTDLGQEGVMMFRSRMEAVTDRIKAFFGAAPTASRFYITPVQPEPRPLMKIRVLPDHQIAPGS